MSRFRRFFSSPIGLILTGIAVPFVLVVCSTLIGVATDLDFGVIGGIYTVMAIVTVGAAIALSLVALGSRWPRATARPKFFSKLVKANVVLLCSVSILLMFVPLSQVTEVTCNHFALRLDNESPCTEGEPQLFSMHDYYLWSAAAFEEIFWADAPSRSIDERGLLSRYLLLLLGLSVLSVTLLPWWWARHEHQSKTTD